MKEFIRVQKSLLLQEQAHRNNQFLQCPVFTDERKDLLVTVNSLCTKDGQKRFNKLNYSLLQADSEAAGLSVEHVKRHVKESQRKGQARIEQIKGEMGRLYGEKGFFSLE